jgi:hypothetical protein
VRALARAPGAISTTSVYPVPDGDTGTNLTLTVRAAVGQLNSSARSGDARREPPVPRSWARGELRRHLLHDPARVRRGSWRRRSGSTRKRWRAHFEGQRRRVTRRRNQSGHAHGHREMAEEAEGASTGHARVAYRGRASRRRRGRADPVLDVCARCRRARGPPAGGRARHRRGARSEPIPEAPPGGADRRRAPEL